MCFTVHHLHPKTKVAEKNIVCWKILYKRNNKSPYHEFEYNLTKTNTITVKGAKNNRLTSLTKKRRYGYPKIDAGLHSYSSYHKAHLNSRYFTERKIVQFIIPKGTKYYYNPYREEYVSLQLKYIKPK
ncbi:MAG: hypothetical protein ABIA91_01435 [Patescibacteria group bacterium]